MGAAASTKRGQRSTSLGGLSTSSSSSSSSSSSQPTLQISPSIATTTSATQSSSSSLLSALTESTMTLRGFDLTTLNATTTSELFRRIQALEQENMEHKMELNLIYALDSIRDDYPDPATMFSAILALMAKEFRAQLSFLYLFDRESEELELWSQHPPNGLEIEKRIRHPASLISFLEEKNNNQSLREGAQDVKISLLDEFPPHFLPSFNSSNSASSNGFENNNGDDNITSNKSPNNISSSNLVAPTYIAAISIIMHAKQMGMLVIGRNTAFSDLDIKLLKAAESQIDSSVVQAHNNIDFMLSNKELEVIYRVDRIRDENHGLEELLEDVVKELDDVIKADVTFVMLYKVLDAKLSLQASSAQWLWSDKYTSYLETLGQEALDSTKLIWHNNDSSCKVNGIEKEDSIFAAMCVPLILQNQIIGVFGALNTKNKNPFLLAHRRLLKAIASQVDNAIYDSLETFRLRQVLGRSVDRKVLEKLLLNPNVEVLKPERTECTVLFADIRGSTDLAERTPPDLLGRFINSFLSTMSQVIISYEGTLDKFIGDEVMAVFNAPFPQKDHALRAVSVAFAMQQQHAVLMKDWVQLGISPPTPIEDVGIGIASGEVIAGEYGCGLRTDYTVIGRPANLAARITSLAPAGSVLCSCETYELVKNDVEAFPIIAEFKGIGQVTVYNIKNIKNPCIPSNNNNEV